MSRSSAAHAVREDLTDRVGELRDVVAPRIESAVQTVATKAPPAIERGRAAAMARGTALGGALGEAIADRLPDDVVDRLPDAVAQHLPKRRRRGRKALLVAVLAAVVGAVVVGRRHGAASGLHVQQSPTPPTTATPAPPAGERPTHAGAPAEDGRA